MIKFIKKRWKPERKIKYVNLPFFRIGDVLFLSYFLRYKLLFFKGICIAKRNKNFKSKNSSFTLRNINKKIRSGLEVTLNTYINKIYTIFIEKFERKRFKYRKAKLYYLRDKINKHSMLK
jgi:ribosomal protein L19